MVFFICFFHRITERIPMFSLAPHGVLAEDVHKALPDVVAELRRLDPKESKDSKDSKDSKGKGKKPKKWGVKLKAPWKI